ncbi:ABC transporter ATP-binding protein [Actinoplanes couchii]|uniref:Multidrug ABC transporter ATP-binding protein n=1 Tax=Actinoplanes couchii TaxID=403638 RepID=A0ABQ3XLR1_9ACTN|nr:ABC transporter ATP-binding protein [Actinoplanes couchii]MDR6319336.1 ABC-2 type transport system ATP-binding protein [Actinoplanes couchii]GID59454.1 multidrug ABC transporter ATP-binding protein [Actinoplanes couchii]
MESNTIEVRGLTKRYATTIAVDDLSFTVRPGRVTGFLGPNGAGKSTTMRAVLGLDRPDAGSATVGGRPFTAHRQPLRLVGALLDAAAVHGGRTAYHHLLALALSNGIGRQRVGEVLDTVGLTDVARRRVKGFSLGMRQRLGIAAALLGDPPVLMLDEPVNGLDPEGIRWIRSLLRSLAAEGRTVFVSSHLMSEMQDTADHLIVVGQGRLVADTTMTDLVRDQDRVLVRTPAVTALVALLRTAGASVDPLGDGALAVTGLGCDRIGDLAADAGLRLHELSPQRASLETAFMDLTRDAVSYRGAAPNGATR